MCVCVCACVCMYVYIYADIYKYRNMKMYVYIYIQYVYTHDFFRVGQVHRGGLLPILFPWTLRLKLANYVSSIKW